MKKWQSFSALKRAKQEIVTLSDNVGNSLDDILSTPVDEKKNIQSLQAPVEAFSPVSGVLDLLGFSNLGLLAREIHLLLVDAFQGDNKNDEREQDLRLELSYVCITDLPALLEDALQKSSDDFDNVFELINRLRKFRGCALVFENRVLLEKPFVDFKKEFSDRPEKMRAIVAKQSAYYAKCCKVLLSDRNNEKALQTLKAIIDNLSLVLRDYKIGGMWGLAGGIFDIVDENEGDSEAIIQLMSGFEQSLKQIISGNLVSLYGNVDETILEALINYISAAKTDSPRLRIIRQWYSLDTSLVKEFRKDYRDVQVAYFNKTAFHSSLVTINEDIAQLIDAINRLSQDENTVLQDVVQLHEKVLRLREVMHFLQMQFLVEIIDQAIPKEITGTPEEALSMLAGVLFSVSKELNNKLINMEHEVFNAGNSITEASSLSSAKYHILVNAMKELESVITLIDDYADKTSPGTEPETIRQLIDELSGVFSVVQLNSLVEQLNKANHFLTCVNNNQAEKMPEAYIQIFSSLVINWLWYLEQLSISGTDDSVGYLEKAGGHAQQLQLYVDSIPVVESVQSTSEAFTQTTENSTVESSADSASVEDSAITEDEDIRAIFAEEFDEVLEMIVEEQKNLAEDFHQAQLLKDCCRYFHTLKGSGNMVGATDIGTLGLAMEKLYEHLSENTGNMTTDVLSFTEKVTEVLPALKEAFVNPQAENVSTQVINELCQQAADLVANDSTDESTEDSTDKVETTGTRETGLQDAQAGNPVQALIRAQDQPPVLIPENVDSNTGAPGELVHAEIAHNSALEPADEQFASAFCAELAELNSRLRELLGNDKSPPVTTDLLIPMHTLYGSARVHKLEEYSRAVQLVEKYIERFPHRLITADMAVVFNHFCDITAKQIAHVENGNAIGEYENIGEDLDSLQASLAGLGDWKSQSEKAADEQGHNVTEESLAVPDGFINEARELIAKIDLDFRKLHDGENPAQSADRIKQSLDLLESAAELAEVNAVQRVAARMSDNYGQVSTSNMAGILLQQEPLLLCHRYLEDTVENLDQGVAPEDCDELLQALANVEGVTGKEKPVPVSEPILSKELEQPEDRSVFVMLDNENESLDETQTEGYEADRQEGEQQDDQEEAVDESLLAVFLDEAAELLGDLDNLYLKWHENPASAPDEGIVDEYLRILHTLKGSAALMMEKQISQIAHDYESLIIESRGNETSFDEAFFTACDEYLHKLHDIYALYSRDDEGHIIKAHSDAVPVDDELFFNIKMEQESPQSVTEVTQALSGEEQESEKAASVNDQHAEKPELETQSAESAEKKVETGNSALTSTNEPAVETEKAALTTEPPEAKYLENPLKENKNPTDILKKSAEKPDVDSDTRAIQATVDEQVRVSSQLLRSLLNDADEINFSRNRIEKGMHDINTFLVDMDETLTRLKSYVKRVDESAKTSYQSAIEESRLPGGIADDFDALEMDRYTELQEMSLSLTEDYDDLKEIRVNLAGRLKDIDSVLMGQQRFTHSLQGGLISSQMVSFSSVVPRFKRLVRQISRELNKDVDFTVDCRQDNLDKNVLQNIISPLEHLLRNALDHGIETPQQRRESGKPEQATLSISIVREGAGIVIKITDDGQGINSEKVKQSAIDKGIVSAGDKISKEEVYQLIFKPGFSTSESVSNISGRGVGLDAVQSEIKLIGGNVKVISSKGKGTTFTLQLPMNSSLDRALVFDVQDTRYVVQMNTLDGVLVKKLADIHQKQQHGETPVFEYNDNSYEYLYLGKLINKDFQPRLDSIDSSVIMLLVSGLDKKVALHVDAVVESRDLVVKSLGKQLAAMQGIAGGVIMPDGNVAVVLDLVALAGSHNGMRNPAMDAALVLSGKSDRKHGVKTVMVVDDSITVRKVTSSILKRNGMNVITAKNGLEAIELLEQQLPDMILLDIEMPKMDGFEVASHIRGQDAPVKDIPIIMITSRIGDKHRNRADEIGVNEYLCKPFLEDNLLDFIDSY